MIKIALKYSILIDKIPICVQNSANNRDTPRSLEISGIFAHQLSKLTALNRGRQFPNEQKKNE